MISERINGINTVLARQNKTGKWQAEQLQKNEAIISRWCYNVSQPSSEMSIGIARIQDIGERDLIATTK